MNKIFRVVKYDITYYLRLTLVVYLWMIGIVVGIPAAIHLVGSGITGLSTSVLWDLSFTASAAVFVNIILLFYFGFLTYERFSFLIQNGISRRTGWTAKVVSLAIISLVATAYNLIVTMLSLIGKTGYTGDPYLVLYGNFFKSTVLDLTSMAIFTYILTFMVAVFGIIAGAIFSLLTRKSQKILLIAIPIFGVLFLALLERIYRYNDNAVNMLENTIKFMIGYSKNLGYCNPVVPGTIMIILIVISLIISRWLNLKLRIKRGE